MITTTLGQINFSVWGKQATGCLEPITQSHRDPGEGQIKTQTQTGNEEYQ